MTKKQRRIVDDPLLRACTACGAARGEGCRALGNDAKPLITKATRLVHADRLEEEHPNA